MLESWLIVGKRSLTYSSQRHPALAPPLFPPRAARCVRAPAFSNLSGAPEEEAEKKPIRFLNSLLPVLRGTFLEEEEKKNSNWRKTGAAGERRGGKVGGGVGGGRIKLWFLILLLDVYIITRLA